jgi:hypothetical protein
MPMSQRLAKKTESWRDYKVRFEVDGKKKQDTIKAPSKLAAVKFVMYNFPKAKNIG